MIDLDLASSADRGLVCSAAGAVWHGQVPPFPWAASFSLPLIESGPAPLAHEGGKGGKEGKEKDRPGRERVGGVLRDTPRTPLASSEGSWTF
jgi:hypothetical protein